MPIWSKPATFDDVTALLGDARLQLGRQTVNRPIDAARAVSRLGVARGIESFTRFGFLERNGQSILAVPLGRIRVRENPRSHLIDDIAGWMNQLQRLARDSHAPGRLVHAERRLADAVFTALTHDHTCERWRAILEAAVDIETIQAGVRSTTDQLPPLTE
jgi:CRISPR-associated protein Csx17